MDAIRDWTLGMIAAVVAVAFATVSLAVLLSGEHPWLLRHKLKIGGLLLTLTATSAGCMPPFVMCYDMPCDDCYEEYDEDEMGLYDYDVGDTISYDASGDPLPLPGFVNNAQMEAYSWRIDDADGPVVAGDLTADDGAFDSVSEEFTVLLDAALEPGAAYTLALFATGSETSHHVDPRATYGLFVEQPAVE